MSDWTAELSAGVKAAGAGISEAVTWAEQRLESARNKYETAAMHGWDGVAGNMHQAAESLEGVVEQLTAAAQAAQTAGGVLDEIMDKMSSLEVAAHLVTASGELDTARGAAESSISLIDESITHCEAARQESLPVSLNSLRDDVAKLLERVRQCRDDVDAEQQEADSFANQDDGEDGPGN
jgi:hypothetical protein